MTGRREGLRSLPRITRLMSCKAGSTARQPAPSLAPEVTVQMELLGIRMFRSRQPWKTSYNWAGRTKWITLIGKNWWGHVGRPILFLVRIAELQNPERKKQRRLIPVCSPLEDTAKFSVIYSIWSVSTPTGNKCYVLTQIKCKGH